MPGGTIGGGTGGGTANPGANLASEGFLTGAGSGTATGSIGFGSTGSLTETGLPLASGSASLSSSGSITPTGVASAVGSSSPNSVGTLSASGVFYATNSAFLGSTSTLTATGNFPASGSAGMTSEGLLSAVSVSTASGYASLASEGLAGGSGPELAFLGSASTLTATGIAAVAGAATAASEGFLSASGMLNPPPTVLLSAGSLSATGTATASGLASFYSRSSILSYPIAYHVYANSGSNDAVNYSTSIGTTSALSFITAPLASPSDWTFAVRAYAIGTGLEERNLDARIRIIVNSVGVDVSAIPSSPILLGVLALSSGTCRVDWAFVAGSKPPATSFAVYLSSGSTVSYVTTAAAVTAFPGLTRYSATLSGLANGTAYVVAVRALNAAGSDGGTSTMPVIGSGIGPTNVDGLTVTAVISR